jgi:molecular chaperone DnaK (HSP70)/TM2 domain-containing membrane protein YozV
MTQPFIGIDFGTCNSSAAWFNPKTGQAEPLRNAEGDEKTPSVVYFGARETVVGRFAEERLESPQERKRVVIAVKRELARKRAWVVDDRSVTPVDAAAKILEKIKRDAEEGHFHNPVTRAVITCPAVFDEVERSKLRAAAELAGFNDVALLEEPVAAALAYAEAGINVGRHVLVYDLGGGTFDLALLVRDEDDDAFRLAIEPRGERIGGEDFDRAIYDYFDAGVRKMWEQPVCADGLDLLLLRQCRRFKESLSASEEPPPLRWRMSGKGTVKLPLNRAKFESLIEKPVERTVRLTQAIQQDAANVGCQLDSVILIGGSSRTPCIVRRLHETLQVEPRKWQKQDVAVALGAAYHAQRLWGEKPTHPVPAWMKSDHPEDNTANPGKPDPMLVQPSSHPQNPILAVVLGAAYHAQRLWGGEPTHPAPAGKKSDRAKDNIAEPVFLDVPPVRKPDPTLVQPSSNPQNPILMAVLSVLLPGLGQMILGQVAKGVVILVVFIAVGAITFGFGATVVLVLSAYDAYAIAVKLRDGKSVRKWEFF